MPSRRQFLQTSALSAFAAGPLLGQDSPADGEGLDESQFDKEAGPTEKQAGSNPVLRVALVGCGGRGTGAARQALAADPDTRLVAVADAFAEPIGGTLNVLAGIGEIAGRVDVPEARRFVGLDCCEQMLAEVDDIDIVLLASPPFFRPTQYAACIDAGKHVFTEKPVATDIVGLQSTIETSRKAKEKGLTVVSGLCWRYDVDMMGIQQAIADGIIGRPTAAQSVRYSALVGRMQPREKSETEFEHQVRNWYFYTWLSGDFIVEQFVHDLDMVAWAMGEYPTSCIATGGRETRPEDQGNIYDHFAAVYTFPSGATYSATTRHQNGATGRYYNRVVGTEGSADLLRFAADSHAGESLFKIRRRRNEPAKRPMHQAEHDRMFEALRRGERIDNTEYMTQSTLMGILGREAAYTGQELTTEGLLASNLSLQPEAVAWDAPAPEVSVATPGITTLER